MIKNKKISLFAAACVLGVTLTGCHTPQKITYFQDISETVLPVPASRPELRVEPYNKLSITVKSKDPVLSSLFNLSIVTDRTKVNTQTTETPDGLAEYTVTPSGDIDFPVLGMIHVEGMTRSEVAAFIKGELVGRNLVKDPVVSVEFLNSSYSVLGEVMAAGKFPTNNDKVTILEAIANAGDLTLQGKRDNVRVIREESDGIHTYSLDLTNMAQLSQSPAYYIKQGDVIYVEPNDLKKRQATVNGNNLISASFWTSIASVSASIAVLIFK